MSVTTTNAEDDPRGPGTPASASDAPAADAGAAPAQEGRALATPAVGRCTVCGAGLALDQRYCVECGTRRGPARFVLGTAESAPSAIPGTAATKPSASALRLTVLAGLIALLLAFGIGMLVGHNTAASGKTVSVVLSGSSSANTGGSDGGTSGSGSSSSTGGSGSSGGASSSAGGSGASSSAGGSGSNSGSSSSSGNFFSK